MSEFQVIESQEQLNQIIGDRIRRAEEAAEKKYAEKYADYSELKKKAADYERQIADYGKQLSEANEKISGSDEIVARLNAQIKDYETASVKTRIAHEVGIPYELANKLTGDDEAAIRKDAESLAKFVIKPQVAPLKSTEEPAGSTKEAALREVIAKMSKGD